eukprot:15469029-Alexandrium_andersonii.AAC.1
MLFCQFHGVPPRNTFHASSPKDLVRIELDRRWADYFKHCNEFYVDEPHFTFKAEQTAFRD